MADEPTPVQMDAMQTALALFIVNRDQPLLYEAKVSGMEKRELAYALTGMYNLALVLYHIIEKEKGKQFAEEWLYKIAHA